MNRRAVFAAAALVVGCLLIVAGVAMLSIPAALVVSGGLLIAALFVDL